MLSELFPLCHLSYALKTPPFPTISLLSHSYIFMSSKLHLSLPSISPRNWFFVLSKFRLSLPSLSRLVTSFSCSRSFASPCHFFHFAIVFFVLSQHVLALSFVAFWSYHYCAFISNLHLNHPFFFIVFNYVLKTTTFCYEATWSNLANPFFFIWFCGSRALILCNEVENESMSLMGNMMEDLFGSWACDN
jgi:hypothetical protein